MFHFVFIPSKDRKGTWVCCTSVASLVSEIICLQGLVVLPVEEPDCAMCRCPQDPSTLHFPLRSTFKIPRFRSRCHGRCSNRSQTCSNSVFPLVYQQPHSAVWKLQMSGQSPSRSRQHILRWLELWHRLPPHKVHPHLNDVAEIFLYFLKTMGISGELGDGWDTDRDGLRSWTQESKMNWALAH